MAHWGWYWKIKRKHTPKELCSWFITLDSFSMFKRPIAEGSTVFTVPRFNLQVIQQSQNYRVECSSGTYTINYEQQSCNYGGFRYFFRCPRCDKRFRLLYCKDGRFVCRKCLNLGYYTQQLTPSIRCLAMALKVKNKLQSRAGSLSSKPPWMKHKTFKRLKNKHQEYQEHKYEVAKIKELISYTSEWARRYPGQVAFLPGEIDEAKLLHVIDCKNADCEFRSELFSSEEWRNQSGYAN